MTQRDPIAVQPHPCASCPYRKDCPSGVWDESEYEKLRQFDDVWKPHIAAFLCHQTTAVGHNLLCRGWLTVHRESLAVRLAVARGYVSDEEVYREPVVDLYASGNEAADAGLAAIRNPDEAARKMMKRLVTKGVAKPPSRRRRR